MDGLFFLVFFYIFTSFSNTAMAQQQQQEQLWCVAKNNAEDPALQDALSWACGPGGADCGPIQPGGPCYVTGDLQSLASYAFNDYYRQRGSTTDACDFSGNAALTSLDPSHDSCRLPSSPATSTGNFTGTSLGTTVGSADSDINSATKLNFRVIIGALYLAAVALPLATLR